MYDKNLDFLPLFLFLVYINATHSKLYCMKYVFTSIISIALLFAAYKGFTGTENASGKTGASGAPGEVTCTSCHSGSSGGSGSVTLTGDFVNSEYTGGQTYNMSVVIADAGISKFGFNLVALKADDTNAGSLTAGTGSQVLPGPMSRQNITHTSAGTAGSGGQKTFNFTWTAPTDYNGQVTFYVAANAANGDGGTNGDKIYTSSLQVSGTAITSLDAGIQSQQWVVFPNPVIAGNVMQVSLVSGAHTVSIIDMQGRTLVRMPVAKAIDKISVPTSTLERGIYIMKMESEAGVQLKRIQVE